MSPDYLYQLPIVQFSMIKSLLLFFITETKNFLSIPYFLFSFSISKGSKDVVPITVEVENKQSLISREDSEMILRRLGFLKGEEELDSDSFSGIFDEERFEMEEVKEAFDVFDENGDGFIDEQELQKILCKLGFCEGEEIENCRRIIRVFDEDDDGMIDFHEFVKLMEDN